MALEVRKSLTGRRAAVLGSGLAGLSAAISLAVRGARVLVLDESTTPAPELDGHQLGDFHFPAAPLLWSGPEVIAELYASAGHRLTDFLSLRRAPQAGRLFLPGSEPLDLPTNPEDFTQALQALPGVDARGARRFTRQAETFGRSLRRYRQGALRDGRGFIAPAAGLGPLDRAGAKASGLGRRDPALDALLSAHRPLQRCTSGGTGLAHGLFWEFLRSGGWSAEGGGIALRQGLLRLCQLLRVRFAFGVRVERIELQAGRVRRISGDGFRPVAVSLVVQTREPRDQLLPLLPDEETVQGLRARWEKLRPGTCRLSWITATNRSWRKLAALSLFPSREPREEERFLDDWGLPALSPTITVECPAALDAGAAPPGQQGLRMTIEIPPPTPRFHWSEDRVAEARERVLRMLELGGVEGLTQSLVAEAVQPEDPTEAGSLRPAGWWLGETRDLGRLPVNRVTEIPGLYLAGPWTQPGSGPSVDVLSGMLAAHAASQDA